MKRTLSKKPRILGNLFLAALLLCLIVFFSGNDLLSPEKAFRRHERGHLVGPSTILGYEQIDYEDYSGMIVADAGDGVILWFYGEENWHNYFIYREKYTENLILTAPFDWAYDEVQIPVVLFDCVPKAACAELRFKLHDDRENLEKEYRLKANRSAKGYFLFALENDLHYGSTVDGDSEQLHYFCKISIGEVISNLIVPVEIRFYDTDGKLIETDTVYVRSPDVKQTQRFE